MADIQAVVLGIDTGFRHVGFCIGHVDFVGNTKMLEYGVADLQAEHKSMNKRSFLGMKTLNGWLESIDKKYGITHIVLETVPPTRFNGRDATLSAACMFRAFAIMKDKEYSELHAMTIKKEATGSGRGTKDMVKEFAVREYGASGELRYDVYDAIAACHVGLKRVGTDFWAFI